MAAIALTIIILLNYLAFYYAYGAFEGSVGTKKKIFFPAKNPVDACREVVEGQQLSRVHPWTSAAVMVPAGGGERRLGDRGSCWRWSWRRSSVTYRA